MHRQLCALKELLRAVSRLEETIRGRYGVTLTEALCLCSIWGGCSAAGSLGDEVALSPSRLSRVLYSLERKGLLERKRRTDDKRSFDLSLTEEGSKLAQSMRDGDMEIPKELAAWGLADKE